MLVSICIPTIRPRSAEICIQSVRKNSGVDPSQYEILSEVDENRIGHQRMLKRLVGKSQGDNICFIGDDTVPQKDFLVNALDYMSHLKDSWGLVGFSDPFNGADVHGLNPIIPDHWLASKKLLSYLGGEFLHTGYKHLFCNTELWLRANRLGRYIFCDIAHIGHSHPFNESVWPTGDHYREIYTSEVILHDGNLFKKRRANGWKNVELTPEEASQNINNTKLASVLRWLDSGGQERLNNRLFGLFERLTGVKLD